MRQNGHYRWRVRFAAFLMTLTISSPALAKDFPKQAKQNLIAATNPTDVTYDSRRKIVYVTSDSQVLRYKLPAKKFLTPFELVALWKGPTYQRIATH